MSEMIVNFICSTIMSVMGLIVVKNISGSNVNLFKTKTFLLMSFLIIIPAFFRSGDYTYVFSIFSYIMMIIVYKEILDSNYIKITVCCGIMLLSLLFLDVITGTIVTFIIPINKTREIPSFTIIANFIYAIIMIIIYSRQVIKNKLSRFINKIANKRSIKIFLILITVIIAMFMILHTLTTQSSINIVFTTNFLIFIVFFLLIIILFGERNNYENLSDEYDSLFKYIQIFEDWIEKEQLTRHEYKNQLAVLRSLTKEKKVKDKIDSIVEDFINIDNDIITQLKSMPSGGLKGLLYYKISIAKKNDINIYIDVDETGGKILSKISDDKQKTLTKLLGIYMDNAIEAAPDSKKKSISIEIYRIKEEVRIVISNTYSNDEIISNRNLKGVSTKGKGRGNGLYFANKLISMNGWVEDRQEIIDDFYIQTLIIRNKKV